MLTQNKKGALSPLRHTPLRPLEDAVAPFLGSPELRETPAVRVRQTMQWALQQVKCISETSLSSKHLRY